MFSGIIIIIFFNNISLYFINIMKKKKIKFWNITLGIIYTKEPYTNFEHSWDVAQFVVEGNREKIPEDCPKNYKSLIERCWNHNPTERPSFDIIVLELEKILSDIQEKKNTNNN